MRPMMLSITHISQRRSLTPSHFSVVLCPSISNKLQSWQVILLQKCGPFLHCSVAGCIPKEIWSHSSRFVQYRLLLIVFSLTGGCYSAFLMGWGFSSICVWKVGGSICIYPKGRPSSSNSQTWTKLMSRAQVFFETFLKYLFILLKQIS